MRIWQQGMLEFNDYPAYRDAAQKHYQSIVKPGVTVVMHGIIPGTFKSSYETSDMQKRHLLTDIQFPSLALMHFGQSLAAAVAAEQQGYDAFAMCYLSSTILNEIRCTVDIPVVNQVEATLQFCRLYGQRFGIVKFSPHSDMALEMIREMGQERNYAGTGYSGFTHEEAMEGFKNPGPVVEKFKEAARKLCRETGADVIIPGEMPLNIFLGWQGVHRVDDIPIVDGAAVTLKLAEALVDLKRQFGLSRSRQGRRNWRPPQERVKEVVEFYGMEKIWAAVADPNRTI